jgi:hypothetical protein
VAVEAVFFDVGEVLVNETREYGTWADWLGIPRHTFSAVFGATIAQGKDYRDTFQVFQPGFDLAAAWQQACRGRAAGTVRRGRPLSGCTPVPRAASTTRPHGGGRRQSNLTGRADPTRAAASNRCTRDLGQLGSREAVESLFRPPGDRGSRASRPDPLRRVRRELADGLLQPVHRRAVTVGKQVRIARERSQPTAIVEIQPVVVRPRQRQANPVPQPDWRSLISDLGLKDVAGQYFALADGPVGRLQRSRGVVPARRDCALPVRCPRPAAGAELASLRHPTDGMWLRTEFASHST